MTTVEKEVTTGMKWYIVRSAVNKERSVANHLINEGTKGDLMGKIGQVLVPTESLVHLKNGKKVQREKVLYPSYIFVQTNAVGELKYHLRGVNGASGFLKDRAGNIESLTQLEVDRMLGVQKEKEEIQKVANKFLPGESVKILDGPFANFVGKVESVKEQKVKVEVMIFGRSNLLELNSLQIEKHNG